MQATDTQNKLKEIHSFIEHRQLKQAIDGVREFASRAQQWDITEKISELETNYQYMLHYLMEGEKDPEQQHIYEKLLRDLYMIADDAAEHLLLQESTSLFFDKLRLFRLRNPLNMDEYRNIITRQMDTFAFIDLLEEGDEKEQRMKENALAHDNTLQDLFYSVYASPRSSADLITSFRNFMDDTFIPVYDKCVFLSALTMNLLHRFDAAKVNLLLDVCHRPEPEIVTRAIIGIIPIFQTYKVRWSLYPECTDRLKLLSDDKQFNRNFIAAIIGFIQAHETEKITKRLTEEIIPEMMKLSPMIGKKIKLDEWMGESGLDEKT